MFQLLGCCLGGYVSVVRVSFGVFCVVVRVLLGCYVSVVRVLFVVVWGVLCSC